MIERSYATSDGDDPGVIVTVVDGNQTNPIELSEGDRQYHEGTRCFGFASATSRQPGQTRKASVAVTWQQDPFANTKK
jgi:hypothetical protein